MNTIYEENEDEEIEDDQEMEIEQKPSTSTANDYSSEVIQQYIKEKRKLYKSSKKLSMTHAKPPKWICTVSECKWGGKSIELMKGHLKKCHPEQSGTQFALEAKFHYGNSRKGSLKRIKKEVHQKKMVEELEEKIKDL